MLEGSIPIYEYRCTSCGNQFDELVKLNTLAEDVACPQCAEHTAERLMSVFAVGATKTFGACGRKVREGTCDTPTPAGGCGGGGCMT